MHSSHWHGFPICGINAHMIQYHTTMAVSGKSYQSNINASSFTWENPMIIVIVSGLITLIVVIASYFITKECMRRRTNITKNEIERQVESRPSLSFISDYSGSTIKNSFQTLQVPKINRHKSDISYF